MTDWRHSLDRWLGLSLDWLVPKLIPARVIMDRDAKRPYLGRHYIVGRPRMPDGTSPYNAAGNPKVGAIFPDGYGLYLHRFHQSDESDAVHSHPWFWCVSFILSGGYVEERISVSLEEQARREDGGGSAQLQTATRFPFTFNYITARDFHSVKLLDEKRGTWSLFLAGPRYANWFFLDKREGRIWPWREWLQKKRQAAPS